MPTHRTWTAAAAALGALALAPAAAADTEIRSGDTFSVSSHAGTVAWSEFDTRGRSRLYARLGDQVERLSAPSSAGLITVDLGARGRRGTRAVFQRCPSTRSCDLYRLDLPDGRARKLRSLSSRRHLEVAPSVWGSTYVFGRLGAREPQVGRSRRGGGLFVKAGRRKLRRITTRIPVHTDVRGRRVAFAWWSASGNDSAIYTTTTTSRRLCRLDRGTARRFVRGPVIDGRRVYWLRVSARTGAARIVRARFPGRSCRRGRLEVSSKRLPRPAGGEEGGVESIAVDRGSVFYSASGVFAADDPPPFP